MNENDKVDETLFSSSVYLWDTTVSWSSHYESLQQIVSSITAQLWQRYLYVYTQHTHKEHIHEVKGSAAILIDTVALEMTIVAYQLHSSIIGHNTHGNHHCYVLVKRLALVVSVSDTTLIKLYSMCGNVV